MTNRTISKLIAGTGILAMMTACSSDEPVNMTGGMTSEGGRNAYMTVNLKDVGAMASHNMPRRAPGETPDDGTFDDGTMAVECDIDNARFFFFDENGVFVSEASVWNGGAEKDPANDNISYEGNTVIVLKNLSDNVAPKYMLTVLNGSGFNPSSTLQATAEALELGWKNDGRFAMTTTSYRGEMTNHPDNDEEIYYYANVIEQGNFMEGNPGEDVDLSKLKGLEPVIVYVERLAAKVELDLSNLSNETSVSETTNRTLYKLDATVAGKPNDTGDQIGDTDLYLDILGWDLNGTSRQSYFSKQLDRTNWTATGSTPWENWNVAQFHRSYWGISPTYGQAYDLNTINFVTFAEKAENNDVIYVNPANIVASTATNDMSGFRYCNERTNTPEIIYRSGKVIPSSLTSIILKARICDSKGNPLDLVRSTNGVLYTRDQYLQYILNNANVQNNLNVWYVIAESGEEYVNEKGETVIATKREYRQVTKDMVTLRLSGQGTGLVTVVPNLDLSKTYYSRSAAADGSYSWTAYERTTDTEGNVTDKATEALQNSLNITLNNGKAEAFNGGASYYSIPIEHETSVGTGKLGYYGVVRNHWYKVTVNKILKVGHGVFVPGDGEETGEQIIPNDPEDPAYYLTAKLRVLSWKRVNQSVDL